MMAERFSDFNMEEFKTHATNKTELWLEFMLHDRFSDATELCDQFIAKYRIRFRERAFNLEEDGYNDMLVVLVFIRGLLDYVQLCQITDGDEDWYKKNNLLESVWIKICDCRERLMFSHQLCQGEVVDLIFRSLEKIEEFYLERFGSGRYVSPGIEADGSLCSICLKDFRACSHIPGRLYSGIFCTLKLINPYIKHVALVDAPVDRRCRIWPWNLEDDQDKNIKAKLMILCTFGIDDFLYSASEPIN